MAANGFVMPALYVRGVNHRGLSVSFLVGVQ
jgi:hypothetical protein